MDNTHNTISIHNTRTSNTTNQVKTMIREKIQAIKNDELVRGSFVLFIMLNLFNLGGYLLHLVVANKLGPAGYGTFATLMSFTLIYGIPSEAIQTIISRV